MRLKILHTTNYTFDEPVVYGLQQLRQVPKSLRDQNVISWQTAISGGHKELEFDDHHRNRVELVSFTPDTTSLSIRCEGEVEMQDSNGIVGPHTGPAPLWLFCQANKRTRAGALCRELIQQVKSKGELDRMHALSGEIGAAVKYNVGSSQVNWTAEDVLEHGTGVCQDHAHVFIACARAMGIPARYVSGYLMLDDRIEQDATHAWAEVHLDGLGWVGFDISNGICPDTRYVRVATGLDYTDAAPVTGTRIGGKGESLNVAIEIAQQ
ncbi:MAG: transglutaminase family protein [Paracoccaceae bacterium]